MVFEITYLTIYEFDESIKVLYPQSFEEFDFKIYTAGESALYHSFEEFINTVANIQFLVNFIFIERNYHA